MGPSKFFVIHQDHELEIWPPFRRCLRRILLNADGKLAFDANFFDEANGKWALFDNFGNVARMPE